MSRAEFLLSKKFKYLLWVKVGKETLEFFTSKDVLDTYVAVSGYDSVESVVMISRTKTVYMEHGRIVYAMPTFNSEEMLFNNKEILFP